MSKMRLLAAAGLATLVLAAAGSTGARAGAEDFDVVSFDATYNLSRDKDNVAMMQVSEKIVADFPSFDQNHGILRAIPEDYKDHSLEVTVNSVTSDSGAKYNYKTSEDNGNLVLKIGDANKYAHGLTTYIINYSLRGVISNQANQQELYWDVNGDQWSQPFGKVTAKVVMSEDLVKQAQPETVCYTGVFGSTESTCTASLGNTKQVTFATRRPLRPKETLTLAIAFKPGTFADYKPSAAQITNWVWMGFVIATPAILALVVALRGYLKGGRDPKGKGVIVPQYTPPKDVTVLMSNAVLKEGFDPKAISATIVDLAVRHYVKIYEVKQPKLFKDKTDYEVELIKDVTDLQDDERQVVTMVFDDMTVGTRVSLKDLQNKLYMEAQKLGKSVDTKVADAGYFRVSPDKAKRPYQAVSGLLFIVSFFFLPWTAGLLAAAAILFIAAFAMPARTEKGVELRTYLFGVRDYMKLAEAERLRVLQSPHGELTEKVDIDDKRQLVKLYEHLLPYAMLFGIEKEWAKEFAPLYDQQPDWYSGSGAFNAVYFATAMNSFGTVAATSFTPPSSSSSSGFGGGAGGGGGGGGGGGW